MTEPRKPEAWPTSKADRSEDQGHNQQAVPDGAAKAMSSEHQAFAGAATGVGDAAYDAAGAFDVTETTRRTQADAEARVRVAGERGTDATAGEDDLGTGAPAPNVTGGRTAS